MVFCGFPNVGSYIDPPVSVIWFLDYSSLYNNLAGIDSDKK